MNEDIRAAPRVAIIILNWNGWNDTLECLESLYQIDYPSFNVVLVENGSKDHSLEKIRAYVYGKIPNKTNYYRYISKKGISPIREYDKDKLTNENNDFSVPSNGEIILIKNVRNFGFSGGCNIGIRYALKALNIEYVLILNNDVIVDKNFLTKLVEVAERSTEIGIAGSTIYYYNNPNMIYFSGGDLILWNAAYKRYTMPFKHPHEADFANGACMLIKKKVIDDIGLLYSPFIVYWDETDFCFRAKKYGYKIVNVPDSKIWHKISASSGGELNPYKSYYSIRNRFLFAKRNLGNKNKLSYIIFFFFYEVWFAIVYFLRQRKLSSLTSFLIGIKDGSILFFSKNRVLYQNIKR